MKKENKSTECKPKKIIASDCHSHSHGHDSSGAIYGLSVIGALFYFLGNATSFGTVMLGIGKAIFWPAILMFKLLTHLQM